MIQIDNTLVSLDVLERQFLCDLSHCKGICCVEGDSGAPLLEEEVGELEKALPVIWDDLAPKAQEIIKKQGVAYIDEEGDLVTSIVNGKDCVFTCYDADGTCKCAVEKAYREGKLSFYKPVSCHLYPPSTSASWWKYPSSRPTRLVLRTGSSLPSTGRKKNSRSISF